MEILTQQAWGRVGDPKFLISSHMVLMLLVFEKQGFRAVDGSATWGILDNV